METMKTEKLVEALKAVTESLVKTVHKTLPDYPESQMMVAPNMSVASVRAIISEAE